MKEYIVNVTVNVPYPKHFETRERATSAGTAIARAMRGVRKQLGRKRIKEWIVKAIQL